MLLKFGKRKVATAFLLLAGAIFIWRIPSTETLFKNAPGKLLALLPSPQTSPTPIPLKTIPKEVKAIYLTSWSASTPNKLDAAIDLIKKTELNAVVIDVKDYTGTVAFKTKSPLIQSIGSEENRLGNLTPIVNKLHENDIYVIARIAVFQDQHLLKVKPELAIKDSSGKIWRDRKGLGWVDPASKEVWEYTAEIAREAAKAGTDELNFDYIRFPSDGNLLAVRYPFYKEANQTKREVIKGFFEYLATELKPTKKILSADLFGLATVQKDDLGIGQVIEDAFPYFDYISPMVYPSHYAAGFLGYKNPAAYPYEIVHYSLENAEGRRKNFAEIFTTTTPDLNIKKPEKIAKIRPWLQVFDLGATYTPDMVRKQIQAVYDAGLDRGWYLWNPSNVYSPAALEPSN